MKRSIGKRLYQSIDEFMIGKLYNTKKATLIGVYEWMEVEDEEDEDGVLETYVELYMQKDGTYFLYGWGNVFTTYCNFDRMKFNREGAFVVVLAEYEAKDWAKEYLDEEICKKFFKEEEEDFFANFEKMLDTYGEKV